MKVEWYFHLSIQRGTVLGVSYCLSALVAGSIFAWIVVTYLLGYI